MSYAVFYQKKAIKEYGDAVEWYLQSSEQATVNFEIALKEKVDLLRANPFCGINTYKRFHEISLNKYPYKLVYLIEVKTKRVVIASIFHTKRNPKLKFNA